jgi:hypothetical protein
MRDALCPHGLDCAYVGDGPMGYPCKPGWNILEPVVRRGPDSRPADETFPQPERKDGGEPCGECHLQPGETCDICGAINRTADMADDYIDQLNVLCEDFGCEPGTDRLHWLHEQLSALAAEKAAREKADAQGVVAVSQLTAAKASLATVTEQLRVAKEALKLIAELSPASVAWIGIARAAVAGCGK